MQEEIKEKLDGGKNTLAVVAGAKVKDERRNSNPLLQAILTHGRDQKSIKEADAGAIGINANDDPTKAPLTPRGGGESQV